MSPRFFLRRLQAWLFVLPLFALGCNGSEHSPTAPVEQPKAASAAVAAAAPVQGPGVAAGEEDSTEALRPGAARFQAARRSAQEAAPAGTPDAPTVVSAARGGNGNGNGNGNGGNGNGGNGNGNGNGNGGGGRGGELTFEIRPATWNTNWAHAAGNVQGFVRGGDVAKIDTGSVELQAGGGSLDPLSVRIAGGQLVATFDKSEAFEPLGDVESGDRETVTLRFTVAGEQKELEDQIRIVGPNGGGTGGGNGGGELELNIQPDDWNVNWEHSAGQVTAFLRGTGVKDVDLATVRLVGDGAGAAPLEPLDVRRVGKQVVARFGKSAAFLTLDDPDAGERHTVKIRFSQGGTEKELSEDVRIAGRR